MGANLPTPQGGLARSLGRRYVAHVSDPGNPSADGGGGEDMSGHRINGLGVILAAALWAAFLVPASPLAAAEEVPDQVLAWNQHAYDELIVGQGPFSVQHMAMVHGAVYDAVNAIDRGYQPYLVNPAAQPTYSKDAAAAQAAHDVLVSLLPGRQAQLDGYLATSLALIPDGPAEQGGIDVGMATADAMMAARAD